MALKRKNGTKLPEIGSKASKLEVKCDIKKKPLTKAEVMVEFKALKEKHESLIKENNGNLEVIDKLKEELLLLKDHQNEKEIISKETQTNCNMFLKCNECNFETPSDSVLDWHLSKIHGWSTDQITEFLDNTEDPRNCRKCEYEAEDKYDLDAHTWTEHDDEEAEESIVCTFCDKRFTSLEQLMKHKKKKHTDKVSSCWKFVDGNCSFGDEKCWFNHNSKSNNFKCSICDEHFKTQSDLMKHRKSGHADLIKECKNANACPFKKHCWYKHEEIDNNENNDKNANIIQKLFEVVEKFTEKVTRLENTTFENNQ